MEELVNLIEESFDDKDVEEVAIYAMSRITLSALVAQAQMAGMTETPNIPPESLAIVLGHDSNMTMNPFYQDHIIAIRVQLATDEAKLYSQRMHLGFGVQNKDVKSLEVAKSLIVSNFDVLTTIAYLYKGVDFANKFDFKMRRLLTLPDEYHAFFSEHGLM